MANWKFKYCVVRTICICMDVYFLRMLCSAIVILHKFCALSVFVDNMTFVMRAGVAAFSAHFFFWKPQYKTAAAFTMYVKSYKEFRGPVKSLDIHKMVLLFIVLAFVSSKIILSVIWFLTFDVQLYYTYSAFALNISGWEEIALIYAVFDWSVFNVLPFATVFSMLVCINCCGSLLVRIKKLTKAIRMESHFTKERCVIATALGQLINEHVTLAEQRDAIQKRLSFVSFLWFCEIAVNLVCGLRAAVTFYRAGLQLYYVNFTLESSYYFSLAVVLCLNLNKLDTLSKKLRQEVEAFCLRVPCASRDIFDLAFMLRINVVCTTMTISSGNMFFVNKSFILSFISVVFAYVVVLVQFAPEGQV